MKILHTADWHLGAKTNKRSRIVEQRKAMQDIVDICNEEKIDLVIIAGDIFDQAVPTSEAEDLFYETLEKLTEDNCRAVIALAGNHDDPRRIESNTHFAKKHNIILAGDLEPVGELSPASAHVKFVEIGKGYAVVESKTHRGVTERTSVAILPYPMEYRLKAKAEAEDYSGKVCEWARYVCRGFKKDAFNVLASHFPVSGSREEAIDKAIDYKVGDVSVVIKADLPRADYYALGHIHTEQIIGGNMAYSGAPLFYSPNQKKAGVLVVESDGANLKNIRFRELLSVSKMAKVVCKEGEDLAVKLAGFSVNDFVELVLRRGSPLTATEINDIRENFPFVTEINFENTALKTDDFVFSSKRKSLSPKELFEQFYKAKKGVEPPKDQLELFVEIMEDK